MKRPCFTPGCPALVERGVQYCPRHTTQASREDAQRRGTERERGYTAAVRRAMAAYRAAHPWCEPCLRLGKRVPVQIVDHRQAIRFGGNPLGPFESHCRSCHGFKTARERRSNVSVSSKGVGADHRTAVEHSRPWTCPGAPFGPGVVSNEAETDE